MASDNNHSFLDVREFTPQEMKQEQLNAEMNDIVGSFLCKEYPGYPWAVNSNVENGVVNFYVNMGHGGRIPYGVTVKIEGQIQLLLVKVRKFGGELLERMSLSRDRMKENEVRDKIAGADFAGRFKIDED